MSRPGIDADGNPDIGAKVEFLGRPESYPEETRVVKRHETHMSWVFLTAFSAWKLKKPVQNAYVDFRTVEARRSNCEEELRLNRRLASGVYRGIVPLTFGGGEGMRLDGGGSPIDWLVHMRRLPEDLMLDRMIAEGTAGPKHGRIIGGVLAGFYTREASAGSSGEAYRTRLHSEIDLSRRELRNSAYGLSNSLVSSATEGLVRFVERRASLLDERVDHGRIVEAHGDLRPEHICLESPPVIVDCLEFNRDLRILDAVSDLAFLALECDRLAAPEIGRAVIAAYREATGDRPASLLTRFYRGYHALLRAKVAIWHLRDDVVENRERWTDRARWYLEEAAKFEI